MVLLIGVTKVTTLEEDTDVEEGVGVSRAVVRGVFLS